MNNVKIYMATHGFFKKTNDKKADNYEEYRFTDLKGKSYDIRELVLCQSRSDKNPGKLYFRTEHDEGVQGEFVCWASPAQIKKWNAYNAKKQANESMMAQEEATVEDDAGSDDAEETPMCEATLSYILDIISRELKKTARKTPAVKKREAMTTSKKKFFK
jgi:hypothetical protein